jgi:hypothetical protein
MSPGPVESESVWPDRRYRQDETLAIEQGGPQSDEQSQLNA